MSIIILFRQPSNVFNFISFQLSWSHLYVGGQQLHRHFLFPLYIGEVTNVREHRAAVRVVFDDGDTGYIPLRHIRLLPDDFPIAGMFVCLC